MAGRFEGSAVWITGATSGLGREMALEFARQGANVAVSGRRQDRLDEVVAEIERLGRRGLGVPCDVSDEGQIEAAVAAAVAGLGKLDVAVANAGVSIAGKVERLSGDDWRRQLDTNVVGAALTARYALPHLKATRGRLGLVGSVAGVLAAPGFSAYTASKYALRAIGQTLSMELYGTGVSCTTLQPGFVSTEIAQVNNAGVYNPEAIDKRPQKLMWEADKAAQVMIRALYSRKREFTFTGHGRLGAFLGQHTPGLVHLAMTRFGGAKRAASVNDEAG